jgi:hypothetical protein
MTDAHIQFLARRKLLTGALVLAVSLPAFGAPHARAANAFDGTWAGLDADGETLQLIFVEGEIIGFYWRGDYLAASAGKPAASGASLAFSFPGGNAIATRNGAGMTIIVHDKRGESRVELKKD